MQDAPSELPTPNAADYAEGVAYEVAANIVRDLAAKELSDIDLLRAVQSVVSAVL